VACARVAAGRNTLALGKDESFEHVCASLLV
jgi:hypothetical protein